MKRYHTSSWSWKKLKRVSNNLKGTNVKALSPEPSHSEKSAVKANLEPIISVNVSAVKLVSLQGFLFFFSGSNRGSSLVLMATVNTEVMGDCGWVEDGCQNEVLTTCRMAAFVVGSLSNRRRSLNHKRKFPHL